MASSPVVRIPATACLITREKTWPTDATCCLGRPGTVVFDEVLVKTECTSVFDRFELALRARNEHIYMQDDDCSVDAAFLYRLYDGDHITNALTAKHYNEYSGTGETLIGWGSFFPKWRVNFERWQARYGNEFLDRAAERVFTLLNQPQNSVIMPIKHIDRPVKMWTQPDHFFVRERIRQMYNLLGKPLPT